MGLAFRPWICHSLCCLLRWLLRLIELNQAASVAKSSRCHASLMFIRQEWLVCAIYVLSTIAVHTLGALWSSLIGGYFIASTLKRCFQVVVSHALRLQRRCHIHWLCNIFFLETLVNCSFSFCGWVLCSVLLFVLLIRRSAARSQTSSWFSRNTEIRRSVVHLINFQWTRCKLDFLWVTESWACIWLFRVEHRKQIDCTVTVINARTFACKVTSFFHGVVRWWFVNKNVLHEVVRCLSLASRCFYWSQVDSDCVYRWLSCVEISLFFDASIL